MFASRKRWFVAALAFAWIALLPRAAAINAAPSTMLPNGWHVTPAGAVTALGTLPLHMIEDPSGRWLAVTTGGYGQNSVVIVDEQSGKVVSTVSSNSAFFYGLAFAGHKLYASTAYGIESFAVSADGTLSDTGPVGASFATFGVTGIAATSDRLYIADGTEDSIVARGLDGTPQWKTKVGGWPYDVTLSKDGGSLYVSDWTSASVSVVDAQSGALKATITVGRHPNAQVLSSDGKSLYVACANDDSVAVIDTASNAVRATIDAGIFPHELAGATPNGLAITSDDKTLFIADAGDNAVVAVDLTAAQPAVFGAFPTGWYPTDVVVRHDGRALFVLDGKGVSGHANPSFPHTDTLTTETADTYKDYVATLATGDIEMLLVPDVPVLEAGLSAVRLNAAYSPKFNGARMAPQGLHVIYVIKENRTYDEVLGDDPRGNGDAHLAIFGRRITPNIHKLAQDFVLLDNFDTDAAVSADGHNWSTQAYADDYVEKLWPASYAQRRLANGKRVYDYEQAGPSSSPAGYLWDDARRNGVSVRDYGEFVETAKSGNSVPTVPSLAGLIDPHYRGFDLTYSDQDRIDEWQREFQSYVAHHNLPQLEIVRLPNDHTAATRLGFKTPYAMVADNDYALGRLVDAVSHSPYWRDTIIFSVEDDAQAGPDHVSDHRAEMLVVSARVRRGVVDHTHYTTASVLRTIEEILGLPPMTQYDAGATTMFKLQADSPDTRPWTALAPLVNLNEVNKSNPDAKTSQALDLDEADAADPATFNAILWRYASAHR